VHKRQLFGNQDRVQQHQRAAARDLLAGEAGQQKALDVAVGKAPERSRAGTQTGDWLALRAQRPALPEFYGSAPRLRRRSSASSPHVACKGLDLFRYLEEMLRVLPYWARDRSFEVVASASEVPGP
jgi:hypothetical protein